MPTSEQQRRAIAYLTRTTRDSTRGAPGFDEAGVMAALGRVRHLDPATVTMAAMRCAADPSLKTPALIGDPSSSVYRERIGPDNARRHTRPVEACIRCGGPYGPACCDAPTQRPERNTRTTEHANAARRMLHGGTEDEG